MDELNIETVSVEKLQNATFFWMLYDFDKIADHVRRKDTIPPRENSYPGLLTPEYQQEDYKRIAWFVINGWTDPIAVDVGVYDEGTVEVLDGRHRFMAAIFLKKDTIKARVDGAVSRAKKLRNK